MGVGFGVVSLGSLIGGYTVQARHVYSRAQKSYLGPPIDGALLTGHFVWWRPALFSGVRLNLRIVSVY